MPKAKKIISFLLCFLFIFEQSGFAQVAGSLGIPQAVSGLSNIFIKDKFRPLHLRSLSYEAQSNKFNLLLDKGDEFKGLFPQEMKGLSPSFGSAQDKQGTEEKLKEQTKTLLNYFFIGLTLPNSSFWVNLRPDGENNIIDNELAQTDVGKILLEADLQLKKDTAKYTSPETPEGKEYWDKLYQKAQEIFGDDNLTIPTLIRPWIVPDEIIIREAPSNGSASFTTSAYIYKATLKVMLEQDYLKGSALYSFDDPRLKSLNEYSSQLIRKLIIPKLTKEINASKRYASLRQVYYSLILAQWFKAQQGLSPKGTVPADLIDSRNLTGLTSQTPWSKSTYFKAYQKSVKNGEYNIQQSVYTPYGQTIKTYFSGGLALSQLGVTATILAKLKLGRIPSFLGKVIGLSFTGNPGEGKIEINNREAPALLPAGLETPGASQNPTIPQQPSQAVAVTPEVKAEAPKPIPSDSEPLIPQNWAILSHGTNLIRPEWQGGSNPFTSNVLVVAPGGLYTIHLTHWDLQDIKRQNRTTFADRYLEYPRPKEMSEEEFAVKNKPFEIRVIFLEYYGLTDNLDNDAKDKKLLEKYGQEVKDIVKKCYVGNEVDYNGIIHRNRFPIIRTGTRLIQLAHLQEKGKDVFYYIPDYFSELWLRDAQELKQRIQQEAHIEEAPAPGTPAVSSEDVAQSLDAQVSGAENLRGIGPLAGKSQEELRAEVVVGRAEIVDGYVVPKMAGGSGEEEASDQQSVPAPGAALEAEALASKYGIEIKVVDNEEWDKLEKIKVKAGMLPADAAADLNNERVLLRETPRFGGDKQQVAIAHEVGHILDKRYNITGKLRQEHADRVIQEIVAAAFKRNSDEVIAANFRAEKPGEGLNGILPEAVAQAVALRAINNKDFVLRFPEADAFLSQVLKEQTAEQPALVPGADREVNQGPGTPAEEIRGGADVAEHVTNLIAKLLDSTKRVDAIKGIRALLKNDTDYKDAKDILIAKAKDDPEVMKELQEALNSETDPAVRARIQEFIREAEIRLALMQAAEVQGKIEPSTNLIAPAPGAGGGAEAAGKLIPQITSNGMEMEILGKKFRVVDVRDEMGYYVIYPLEEFYSRSEGNDFAIKIRNHISEKLGIPIKETSIEGLIVIEDEVRGRIMSIRQIEEDFIWIDIEGEWSLYDVFGYKEGKSTMEEWIKAQPVDAQPRLSKIAETMVKNDYGAPGLSSDDRAFWNMYLASGGIINDGAEEIVKGNRDASNLPPGPGTPAEGQELSQNDQPETAGSSAFETWVKAIGADVDTQQKLRDISAKLEKGQELTPEEEKLWNKYLASGGLFRKDSAAPGGIDFSALPIRTLGTVPLGSQVKALTGTVPKLDNFDLDTEWRKIEDLVNSGEIPSAESIKEYIQASCLKGSADKDIDKVLSCIADILRIEEEFYIPTEPLLIDILTAVESASSLPELKAAFIGNL